MDYKKEIYLLGLKRRLLARQLNLSYSAFEARLCETTPWKYDEETRLQAIIKEAKKGK